MALVAAPGSGGRAGVGGRSDYRPLFLVRAWRDLRAEGVRGPGSHRVGELGRTCAGLVGAQSDDIHQA